MKEKIKEKIIAVFDKLKKECCVDYEIRESGNNYIDVFLNTDFLSYYNLYILRELDNYSEYSLYPVNDCKFLICVPF